MSYGTAGPAAVLHLPDKNEWLIMFATGVHDHVYNNAHYPNPSPTLAVFQANIAALADAQAKALAGGKGAAKLRNAKRKRVREDLAHLRDYVQSIVEVQTDPVVAQAMIESAFMSVRKVAKRHKQELRATNLSPLGNVELIAKAVAKVATYYWEYSSDQQSWSRVPDTMAARTVISGFTPGQKYYFRFRALTRKGETAYSQVVSLLIH